MNYLENDSPTNNSIISCIIQEPWSDRLISEEGFETNSVSLITNKGPSRLYLISITKLVWRCEFLFGWWICHILWRSNLKEYLWKCLTHVTDNSKIIKSENTYNSRLFYNYIFSACYLQFLSIDTFPGFALFFLLS